MFVVLKLNLNDNLGLSKCLRDKMRMLVRVNQNESNVLKVGYSSVPNLNLVGLPFGKCEALFLYALSRISEASAVNVQEDNLLKASSIFKHRTQLT